MPILMLTAALPAGAEEITSGNFRYEIVQFVGNDEDEAVVVGLAEGYEPSGELFIPTTVSHEGKEVKVRGLDGRTMPATRATLRWWRASTPSPPCGSRNT